MPTYRSHPLPGMPGGEPPWPRFGWGPELGDDEDPLGLAEPAQRGRGGVVIALLVACGAAVGAMIAVLATKTSVL